ncbi:unnamed protein product [Cuscuta epithymum]|uniref:WRKY domain-containing protein n=1 Tax=Cuscuta epithymum TaxID=186058 RepID=A0AAV0FJK1_9ASTE|nr:unnamed protein product [Cuscuta epithymum]
MATQMKERVHEVSLENLMVKQDLTHVSDKQLLAEGASVELQNRIKPKFKPRPSQSREKKVAELDNPKIAPLEMKQRQNVAVDGSSASQPRKRKKQHPANHGKDNDASQFSQVFIVPKEESVGTGNKHSNDEGNHMSDSLVLSRITSEEDLDHPKPLKGVFDAHSDGERVTHPEGLEKGLDKLQPRRNPEIGAHAPQFDQRNGQAPEKPSEDGYNWRKYGQKFVRGNEFIRSYYKCTHINCTAKRQVERSHGGHIAEIKYIGNHEHPKPQNSPQVSTITQDRRPDLPASEVTPGEKCETTETKQSPLALYDAGTPYSALQSHNLPDEDDYSTCREPKKQKKVSSSCDDNKPHGEPKHVVQTMTDGDIVSDGYRWRKYGQKFVKGNPYPRSYYRCSNSGCPAKKHVEKASHDPKMVMTTYEGKHVHDMPPCRATTLQKSGECVNATNTRMTTSGDPRQSETVENKYDGSLDMVVYVGAT